MASSLPFRKFHGLGNDFIIFDGLLGDLPLAHLLAPDVVTRLCDRHLGIGADGVLFVLEPSSREAQATMRVINADGSEAEMCGNGIRCVAKALRDHNPRFKGAETIAIDTGAGLLRCDLILQPDHRVGLVRVDMGPPSLERDALPMTGEGSFIESPIRAGDREFRGTAVSMGNPHLVIFLEGDEPLRRAAQTFGPQLERSPLFPNRTNVEFARLSPEELEVWVWERGCGITLACGTGACAAAVAATVTGRHRAGIPLSVRLPGGCLKIEVAADQSRVWMAGPAEEVFQGQLLLDIS